MLTVFGMLGKLCVRLYRLESPSFMKGLYHDFKVSEILIENLMKISEILIEILMNVFETGDL